MAGEGPGCCCSAPRRRLLQGRPGCAAPSLHLTLPGTATQMEPPETTERGESPPCNAVPVDVAIQEASPVPPAEEEVGVPIPSSGLLQVTERRQPLSSVSSLEVHFDLLDLTELTDMSDQELAEVFADSDDENPQMDPSGGSHQPPISRGGYLRSPSWTRTKVEQGQEKKHLSELELQSGVADGFLTVEKVNDE